MEYFSVKEPTVPDSQKLALLFVGRCLATKVFMGKLMATRGVWVIIG